MAGMRLQRTFSSVGSTSTSGRFKLHDAWAADTLASGMLCPACCTSGWQDCMQEIYIVSKASCIWGGKCDNSRVVTTTFLETNLAPFGFICRLMVKGKFFKTYDIELNSL